MPVPKHARQNRSRRAKVCLTIALEDDLYRFVSRRAEYTTSTKSAVVNEFLRVGIKELCRRVDENKQTKHT